MRWDFLRKSGNVEDRRGARVSGPVVGGGIGMVVLAVIVTLLGGDPSVIFENAPPPSSRQAPSSNQANNSPEEKQMSEFVSAVLGSTEDVWQKEFQQMGGTYKDPKLVLFTDAVESACGFAKAATGPFYCPRDEKVYIDLSFYEDLKTRHNAPGDFAQAYVIAHEVGHHVQKQLGISSKVSSLQQQVSTTQANQLSVMLELQADCFAGVWANHANQERQIIEPGDVEEALNAASSIGDDRLQEEARGYVVPESFTHGTSAQRVRWFQRGIQSGNPEQCNTFEAARS